MPLILETSFKYTMSVPMPTSDERPTEMTFLESGLWMILSTVIITLDDARSLSTAKLWVAPNPVIVTNVTPIPAPLDASDAPIATLILSLSILIA